MLRVIAVSGHTQIHTLGGTPLEKGSVPRIDYLTTHNTHKRQTSMPTAAFEAAIPADPRLTPRVYWDQPPQ